MTAPLDRLLQQTADGYQTAHTDQYGMPAHPPRAGVRTKPHSRPPTGDTPHIRAALITCARHLADALQRAGGPNRPPHPGFTHNLGFRAGTRTRTPTPDTPPLADITAIRHRDDTIQLVIHHLWAPDATDVILTPPPPNSIRDTCKTIAGHAAHLDPHHTRHLSTEQLELAHAEYGTVVGLVRLAHTQVRSAGGFPDEARRLQRMMFEYCNWQPDGDDTLCGDPIDHPESRLCSRHYQRRAYLRRKAAQQQPA